MQFLVVNDAYEQVSRKFLSGNSVVKCFSTTTLESQLGEHVANSFRPDVFESCPIHDLAHLRRSLSSQSLDELADCHSGRYGVWIDYHVWNDAVNCEWHVFLRH